MRWLLAVALLYPALAWGQIGGGVTTVTDLTTTVANALKITVSGGTVTNLGGGNAEISLSGGGVGCTPAGGNATTNLITYGTSGACAVDIFANVASGALTLGASGTLGSLILGNATSGTINIHPVTGAITGTILVPTGGGTLALAATTLAGYGITDAAKNGANSDITSLSGLTTPLSVAQGGSGAATLTSAGIVLAHGTSPFTALAEVDGDCVVGAAGAWTAASCPGGGGTPGGSNGQVQFNNSGSFGGLTNTQLTADINAFSSSLSGAVPSSGGGTTNFLRADGSWGVPPGTGGVTFANPSATAGPTAINGTLATTAMRSDASPAIQKASNAQFGLVEGDGVGITCAAGVCSSTATVETAQTASFSVAAGDMGKTTPVNISGGGTITLPLSGAFSTVFGSGQTWCGINTGATADTVTNSTGGTMTPSITSLASGAQLCLQSDGAALYATYTLGAYSGSGTVTTSGSPASGDIAQFSSSTAITTATATGTGSVVRATSPTLVTPALGTPASGNGANLTNIQNAAVTAAPLPTPGAGATLAAPRSYYVCTTTCSMTLPVPAAGDEFCIQNDVGVSTVITLLGIGSSARYGKTDQSAYGTAGTGTFVSGGATGDKICLLGRDSTHYLTASFNGTWTAN